MKFYNQSDLFQVLLSAAARDNLRPDAALLKAYKAKRLALAIKCLRSRNVWLYAEGTRTVVDLNNQNTIYTTPTGARMLCLGYADSSRYGRIAQNPAPGELFTIFNHRVRIVGGGNERALSQEFIPSEAGVSGEPRFSTPWLTVPEVIEANEQFAIDLGFDTAGPQDPGTYLQAFIFFCLKVKEQLTPQDQETIADIQRHIDFNDFQEGGFLNCTTLGQTNVVFPTANINEIVSCETRPVSNPTLVLGFGTNLACSRITIIDTGDGSSFSLNNPMRIPALNLPNWEGRLQQGITIATIKSYGSAWTNFFQFPMPHLLRAGASLRCDLINNSTTVDPQSGQTIMFQTVSV